MRTFALLTLVVLLSCIEIQAQESKDYSSFEHGVALESTIATLSELMLDSSAIIGFYQVPTGMVSVPLGPNEYLAGKKDFGRAATELSLSMLKTLEEIKGASTEFGLISGLQGKPRDGRRFHFYAVPGSRWVIAGNPSGQATATSATKYSFLTQITYFEAPYVAICTYWPEDYSTPCPDSTDKAPRAFVDDMRSIGSETKSASTGQSTTALLEHLHSLSNRVETALGHQLLREMCRRASP